MNGERLSEAFNGPGKDYPTAEAAKRARDARARELRKQGYTVTCGKWDFSDLARAIRYTLEATKSMKAILTKTLPHTEHKPTRVKAYDSDGNSVVITASGTYEYHREAALCLCRKMKWKHGESMIGGGTKEGYAWVFTQDAHPIQRRQITTANGHELEFFYNRENHLLVVDLAHGTRSGGNELVRKTLDEPRLLAHCAKLPLRADD